MFFKGVQKLCILAVFVLPFSVYAALSEDTDAIISKINDLQIYTQANSIGLFMILGALVWISYLISRGGHI